MAEAIDTSQAPRGVKAASALVEAVAALGDMAEHHYLEIKGPLDLSSKTTSAKIAKFILGAANRSLDKAASAFEGCAAIIIGVSGSKVEGVEPIEILELSRRLQPFLGTPGPRWDVVWVPIVGTTMHVLVLVVEPPKRGQGPFICRRNGEGVADGKVYVRGDGETREATAEELDDLIECGRATEAPSVDFEVSIHGEAHPIILDEEATLEAYIATTRSRLIDALPKPMSTSLSNAMMQGMSLSALAGVSNYFETAENRTEDQYLEEIDDWENAIRAAWQGTIETLAGYYLPAPIVQISNRAKTFFHDVELKIHLDGTVRVAGWRDLPDDIDLYDLDLPAPPRKWGPRASSMLNYLPPLNPTYDFPNVSSPPPRTRWRNSNSVDLVIDAGEIRPLALTAFDDEEFVLTLPPSEANEIRGTWTITARGFHEVFTGELIVRVGDTVDLTPHAEDALFPAARS